MQNAIFRLPWWCYHFAQLRGSCRPPGRNIRLKSITYPDQLLQTTIEFSFPETPMREQIKAAKGLRL